MDIFEFLDRPIAYHRALVPLAGTAGAIFLSQAIYWSKRTADKEGWFYKTAEEWEDETGLTRRVQEGVREKLKEGGIIEEKLAGNPARLFFRINQDKLIQFYQIGETSFDKKVKQVSTNCENKFRQIGETIYTETTTENTTIEKKTKKEKLPLLEEKKNSKNSILPLSDLERWELAKSLNIQLDVVKKTEAAFWDYVEDPRKIRKYKTSYLTIKQWIRRRIEDGSVQENDEIGVLLLNNQHPDIQAQVKWAYEQVKANEAARDVAKGKV